MDNHIRALRELAQRVAEIAAKPIQDERRTLWRNHNSFERTRPPIYVRAFAFDEWFDEQKLECEDALYRQYERHFHSVLFRDAIGDDFIVEPWVTLDAVYDPPPSLRWGVKVELGEKAAAGGAAAFEPELLSEEDIDKLTVPKHSIDERATSERHERLHSAIGDIIDIHVDRGPMLTVWTGDISTDLAKLRGLEQIMWDAYDRPEWLHRLLAFMRDSILKVHREAEESGDLSLANHQNQAMPYAKELQDPEANTYGSRRQELWGYMASQETTTFGPDMFYEFMLQYQIPILENFGLAAYGCCEDLSQKIHLLREVKNLRRIAVTPWADVERCAEAIGQDYIVSWRPNPSSMVSTGLDEDFVRSFMREHLQVFRANGSFFDITLKDVETVNHQPDNIARWVQIVKEEIDKAGLDG